jgi:outer membrane immunogenic protein
MKKTIAAVATAAAISIAAPAFAADLPMKAAPYVPPPVWTWTGFYVGGFVGAGWGETESAITSINISPPPTTVFAGNLPFNQNSRSGFLGGGQAGYNWQTGLIVLGVEADIAGLDVKGTDPCALISALTCTTRSNWLATVSGRVGAVILDRGLIYVKGGGAWLNSDHSVNLPTITTPPGFPFSGASLTSASSTTTGWLLGFGTEWMITRNWTAFIEYDYMDFRDNFGGNNGNNVHFTINPALTTPFAVSANANIKQTLSVAKVGVNYKFDWGGGVVAKY